MAPPEPPTELPRHSGVGRYLLDGERIVMAAHQHWARVAEPVASTLAGLVLVVALDSSLPARLGLVADLLWWAWFVLAARAIWRVLERRHDWFVATDKRLILTYGLITQKVAMMPLTKVTDMSYNRSPVGRLLGYGTFVMESAGQDQALRTVGWVAEPDHTYRIICAEMFGVEDHELTLQDDRHDHRFGGTPGIEPDSSTFSTAIPIHRDSSEATGSAPSGPQPSGSDIHDADTGPIHY